MKNWERRGQGKSFRSTSLLRTDRRWAILKIQLFISWLEGFSDAVGTQRLLKRFCSSPNMGFVCRIIAPRMKTGSIILDCKKRANTSHVETARRESLWLSGVIMFITLLFVGKRPTCFMSHTWNSLATFLWGWQSAWHSRIPPYASHFFHLATAKKILDEVSFFGIML